jgi:hypothetical protein
VIRYYMVLLLFLGFGFHPLWLLCLLMLVLSASVDYHLRQPKLNFLSFFCYYALDHMSYQLGVLIGCVRAKTFRSYIPRFMRRLDSEVL